MVFKLMEGFQGPHKNLLSKMFKNQNGKISKDPKENENSANIRACWHNIFMHADFDESVIEDIPPHDMFGNFGKILKGKK